MKGLINTSAMLLTVVLLLAPGCAVQGTSKVIVADDVKWGYLNPLRGELSPGAADLWGDRTTGAATGMLVRFKKGFSSPPHIHNITYRGIVIDGLMHNDDPKAAEMWLPKGSFWTQPAGEEHITAANAETNMIYLEIDSGPYLVKPSEEGFDNGERPLNLHKDNIVWLDRSAAEYIKKDDVYLTYLWGQPSGLGGSMVKLPAGFEGSIKTKASEFRVVLISGELGYGSSDNMTILKTGSYLESVGKFTHKIKNESNNEAIIYIRTDGEYVIK